MEEKFHNKSYEERLKEITSEQDLEAVFLTYKNQELEKLTENYLTSFPVPVGILRELTVNNKKYIVPIATEEPSVVAAANKGAKLIGNILAESSYMYRRGQILTTTNPKNFIFNNQDELFEIANDAYPNIVKRFGGLKEIKVREIDDGKFSVDLIIDTVDAMGANIVNTIAEAIGGHLFKNGIEVLTSIVSNLPTESLVTVKAEMEIDEEVGKKIQLLSEFSEKDIYRATTDNKGFLNGASGVVLATGNDWRAFEAGAYINSTKKDSPTPFTKWKFENKKLTGVAEIPVNLGIVGGTISVHPVAKANLELMNVDSATELSQVVVATGLAQNFAALLALVTTGIQPGHMKMHNRANNKNE